MSNLELWNKVKTTDPAQVKRITGKSYQGNSPKPYWLIQRATEVFGPVGRGWGVDVKSERFERLSDTDVLHVAVVSVWYVIDGEKTQTFDQMGGTKACYMTAAGKLMIDEDAGKKSVTDGMVKCLSMIGFAGDIFSGQWDDSKYVASARAHFAPEPETKTAIPESFKSTPNSEELDIEPKRRAEIEVAANLGLKAFGAGDQLGGFDEISGITDNEEKLYLWQVLRPHSAFRTFINKRRSELNKEVTA